MSSDDSDVQEQSREDVSDLEGMLDRLLEATEDCDKVTLENVLDTIGTRSFGPVLLFVGLLTMAPIIGDIPGVPTLMGLIVLLIVGQLPLQQEHIWMPAWMLKRSVSSRKMSKALHWFRKPAHFIDRFIKPRLEFLVLGPASYAIALVSIAVALLTPVMEFVPFSANGAGIIWTAFGLALIARDGLLSLVAFTVMGGLITVLAMNLF